MQLAMLKLETKLQKCNIIGITIFKFFIWVGISLDIWSEIMFYCSAVTVKLIFNHISDDIPAQMKMNRVIH